MLLVVPPAFGFDFDRYKAADLDALLAQHRPREGLDIFPPRALKLDAALVSYAEPCPTGLLSKAMTMAGVTVNATISRCIRVRSAKGKQLRVFIQDQVSDFLRKEIPLGHHLTPFAVHLYTTPEGPGLLVNEFKSGAGNNAAKSAAAGCGCGGKVSDLRGEWRHNGPGFACRVATGSVPEKVLRAEVLSRACQHIGPFVIGQQAQAHGAALGEPHRKHAGAPGQTQIVYFLEQRDHYPYLVATISKERIVALQVTGTSAAQGYSFNHVELGATTDTLGSYFGQPNHVEPSELKDTELWAYRPWPFTFEVNGGHVTSIRISEP
jgi:hypothetical protein